MQVEDGKLVSDEDDETSLVETLSDFMTVKLRENRGKQHWVSAQVSVDSLLTLLDEEVNELRVAAAAGPTDDHDVWQEAADVANFAAMVADRITKAADGV